MFTTFKTNRHRAGAAIVVFLGVAALTGTAAALSAADGSASAERGITLSPRATGQTDVTPARPEPNEVPEQMYEQPFVDGRAVVGVADASGELSFRPAAPASLGRPVRVFLHRDYRPQALALVYDHPTHGRLTLTEEPVEMPESLQRQGLEDLAAGCDPARGCVGSWTMHNLGNGNRALVISSPPDVTAVVWIQVGGIRFQLIGRATSLTVPAALAVANVTEAAA